MLRFHLALLDPNELNDPSYYRVWRNPPVACAFSISEMGTYTCFPHSALPHANNTSLEHGGWITPPDLESILTAGLIIRGTYFLTSVEKTLVLDGRNSSKFCGSPAANFDILDSDTLLLFYVDQGGS